MSSMQQSIHEGHSEAHSECHSEGHAQLPNLQGQFEGHSEDHVQESVKEIANMTVDKEIDASHFVNEPTHAAEHQETSSFLQQTGEQMLNMAQGAVDTVKNTLGMNDDKKN